MELTVRCQQSRDIRIRQLEHRIRDGTCWDPWIESSQCCLKATCQNDLAEIVAFGCRPIRSKFRGKDIGIAQFLEPTDGDLF
ncbi:MAG: hypothetical protein JW388_1592 [Nitrospira sp.]|nr:hypothetical protein [Nitrospira sp.]